MQPRDAAFAPEAPPMADSRNAAPRSAPRWLDWLRSRPTSVRSARAAPASAASCVSAESSAAVLPQAHSPPPLHSARPSRIVIPQRRPELNKLFAGQDISGCNSRPNPTSLAPRALGGQASRDRSVAFLLSALIVLLFDELLDRNTGSLRQPKGVSEESHTTRPYPTMNGRIGDPAKRGSFRRAAHRRNRACDRVRFCPPVPPLHATALALVPCAYSKNEPSVMPRIVQSRGISAAAFQVYLSYVTKD